MLQLDESRGRFVWPESMPSIPAPVSKSPHSSMQASAEIATQTPSHLTHLLCSVIKLFAVVDGATSELRDRISTTGVLSLSSRTCEPLLAIGGRPCPTSGSLSFIARSLWPSLRQTTRTQPPLSLEGACFQGDHRNFDRRCCGHHCTIAAPKCVKHGVPGQVP